MGSNELGTRMTGNFRQFLEGNILIQDVPVEAKRT